MIPWLIEFLQPTGSLSALRVLDYLSVRAGLALAFSFLLSVLVGPWMIDRLRRLQAIQYIRVSSGENAISLNDMHAHKKGVPTMGGLLMMLSVLSAVLLFGNFSFPVLWLAVFGMLAYGGIGFADDYLKCVMKNSAGLSAKAKIVGQVFFGAVFGAGFLYFCADQVNYRSTGLELSGADILVLPFLKDWAFSLGLLFIPFAILVLTATSNAVNLTDGLDGLAAGVTISVTLCFAIVAYLIGRVDSSQYLIIPHVEGAGELTVILAALCGACFGFLWFNAHPAQVFMGDTGSMMLGGLLGSTALLIKQEALLLIAGGIFVAEAVSVILQVGSYKIRKKRIFRMAPLHHHFERGGIPESKIIARFWIVSALLSLAGLVTLKFR